PFETALADRETRPPFKQWGQCQYRLANKGEANPALWRPLLGPAPLTASILSFPPLHYRRFQPHPDQLQNRTVHNPGAQTRQKLRVRNRIEIAFQVRVASL